MNIYEKLQVVQEKLKVSKENFNAFGKYKYRSCEDILEGVKPLLKEVKAIVTLNDTIEFIGDRYYIKATATIIDVECQCELDKKIEVSAYAREDLEKKGMDLAQVTGSVSSYARKYALNGLFCIDDTKDSDATNKHGKEDMEGENPKIDKIKIETLKSMLKKSNTTEKSMFDYYRIKSYDDITVALFMEIMPALEKKEKKILEEQKKQSLKEGA